MLPSLHERGEVRKLHGFDLLAQSRERATSANLDHAPRAPFQVLDFSPELPSYQLAGPFPLYQSRLDPFVGPSVTVVPPRHRDGSRLGQKPREDLPTSHRLIHDSAAQYRGNEPGSVTLLEAGTTARARHGVRAECRHVSRIRLGQNEAPLLRLVRAELNCYDPAVFEELGEGLAANT